MKKKKKPETFYQDLARKYICKKFGCVAVRELNFGGPKFDVVGFSPDNDAGVRIARRSADQLPSRFFRSVSP